MFFCYAGHMRLFRQDVCGKNVFDRMQVVSEMTDLVGADQMTPDLVTKAISALRQAEKKASLAMRREAEGNQGEALALWAEIMGRYFPTS